MALTPFFRPFSSDPFAWDPFSSCSPFDPDFPSPFRQLSRDASAVANTQVDWKETPDAHVFRADLPGLKKEEIKVELEDGRVLSISGERSKEEITQSDKWHRVERSRGSFLRRFRLPDNANPDDMTAHAENGVLTITIPKVKKHKPDIKSITISG